MFLAVFQFHGGTDAHDGENPKANGVQCAHQAFIAFQEFAFQQFLVEEKQEEQQAGSEGRRAGIGDILEHFRRVDAQEQVADAPAAHCSGDA